MKSKIIVGSWLLLSYAGAQAEYSYSDRYIIGGRCVMGAGFIGIKSQNTKAPDYVNAASLFLVTAHQFTALHQFFPNDKLEKINRYNGWYNDRAFFIHNIRNAAIIQIVEPAVFLGIDHVFEKYADAASQTGTAQSIKQAIPAEYHTFAVENGKFVLAAAGARFVGAVVANNESLPRSAKLFGVNAVAQLTSAGLETYIINPRLDQLMGIEDSTGKTVAKFVTNGLIVTAMCQVMRR